MPGQRKTVNMLATIGLGAWTTLAPAAGADCRDCHFGTNPAVDAPDFAEYFANRRSHHSVGVAYPAALGPNPDFKQPTGRAGEISFFDANGNGVPDVDEIQLFGAAGGTAGTVECASCHREHGNGVPAKATLPAAYLRLSNARSALCAICHRS